MESVEHFTDGSVCGCPEWWGICPDPDTSSLDSPQVLLSSLSTASDPGLTSSSINTEAPRKPQPQYPGLQPCPRLKKSTEMKHEKVHMFTDDFEAKFLNPFEARADHLPTPPPWVSSESSDEPVEDDEQIQDNWPPPKPSTTLFHPLQDYFHRPSTVLRPPSPTQGGPCHLLLSLLLPDPTGHPPLGPPGLPLQAHPRLQVTPSPLPNTLEAAERRRLRNRRMKERRNEKKRLAGATPLGAPAPPKGQGPDVWSQHQLPPKPPTKVQPQSQRQKWWANAKKRGREQDGRLISLRGRRYGYPSLSALLGEIREAGEDGEEEAVGVEREDDQEAWFLEGFEDLFPAAAVAVGRLGRGPSSGGDG